MSKFDVFKTEEKGKHIPAAKKESIIDVYEGFKELIKSKEFDIIETEAIEEKYSLAHDCTVFDYSLEDIVEFCQRDFDENDGLSGLFISALINSNIGEGKIELSFDTPPQYLGYKHSSGELVLNKANNYLGTKMSGGEILVKGDARDHVGEDMQGGRIKITGKAGSHVGYSMDGGHIEVETIEFRRTPEYQWPGTYLNGGKVSWRKKVDV